MKFLSSMSKFLNDTPKVKDTMQWIIIAFTVFLMIFNSLIQDFMRPQVDLLSKPFKMYVVVYFILYTILISTYCYYMGKNSGEKKKNNDDDLRM